jgi:hypothetical protein
MTTGRKTMVEKGRPNLYNWAADSSGRVRIGIGYNSYTTKSTLLYRASNENALLAIDVVNLGAEEELEVPFYFVPDTNHGYVLTSNDEGMTTLAGVDLTTGKSVRTVYDEHHVEKAIVSVDGTKLLGVETNDRDKPIKWLDPVIASYQEKLEKASPQSSVTILSFNQDHSKMLVRFSTPDNPGLLFYYDGASGDFVQFASMHSHLGGKRLSRSKYVTYKACDGLEIEGILTLPRGKREKDLPFIIMPHGGPWAHDQLGKRQGRVKSVSPCKTI